MRGWGLFFFLLFLFIILGAISWVAFTQIRARRSGLPPPSWRSYIPFLKSGSGSSGGGAFGNLPTPRSSNPIEWIRDKIEAFRRRGNRTAQGHYEEAGGYGGEGHTAYGGRAGGRRARGMDPDEAWDTRVGNETDSYGVSGPGGYYEDQELRLAPTPGLDNPYASHHEAAMSPYGEGERGRSKSRDPSGMMGGQQGLDTRYDQEMGRADNKQNNPFSDDNEAPSLRGVSPRPMVNPSAEQNRRSQVGGGSQENSPTERKSMFRESL